MKETVAQQKKKLMQQKDNKLYQENKKIKFPNCIGMFPECVNVTKNNIIEDCEKCPYFDKEEYTMEMTKQLKPEEFSEDRKKAIEEGAVTPKTVSAVQKNKKMPELDSIAEECLQFLKSKNIEESKISVVISRMYRMNKK